MRSEGRVDWNKWLKINVMFYIYAQKLKSDHGSRQTAASRRRITRMFLLF